MPQSASRNVACLDVMPGLELDPPVTARPAGPVCVAVFVRALSKNQSVRKSLCPIL